MLRKWLLKVVKEALGTSIETAGESKSRMIDRLEADIVALKEDQISAEQRADTAKQQARRLTENIEDLKLKKKIEGEDIKHLVKIDQERKDIALDKEKLELEREKDKSIQTIREEYQKKQETLLNEQIKKGEEMYKEILKLMPDVNMAVRAGSGFDKDKSE